MARKRSSRIADGFWNLLTTLVVMTTLIVLTLMVTIYLNPQAIFNPFPPLTMPEPFVLPTATPAANTIEPVWTATPEPTIAPTETRVPTATQQTIIEEGTPVAEITPQEPTETPFVGYLPFAIQNEPNAINGAIFKPDLGCNWLGVAGQVFDLQGRPVKGIRVLLRGNINGERIDFLGLTLESSPYGPSGFEFTIADRPLASNDQLYLQLLDQAGIPISNKVYFDTYEDCERNLVLINFKQVR